MKPLTIVFALCFVLAIGIVVPNLLPAQTPVAKGPMSGSVTGGVVVSTDNFSAPSASETIKQREADEQDHEVPYLAPYKNMMAPKGPEGSNYFEDRSLRSTLLPSSRPLLFQNFQGIPDAGNIIPPDPIMAVGPNHVLACVNSQFRIWDKKGTILKTIAGSSWFSSILPKNSLSDPKVVYDHFANRWVIVWLDIQATEGHYLISVSDDDNPLGTWYTWALPSNTIGDSTVTNWGDYEGVGFDSQAIYITSNQFTFSTPYTFQYAKVRIIGKAQLYANNAGPVTWTDFWDLRDPNNTSVTLFGTRPAITFGVPNAEFFISDSPYRPGTFVTISTITSPLTTPSFSARNVSVVQYQSAPSPNQLGGSTTLLEGGGSQFRNEPVYRDSSLWAVHAIASGTNSAYSAVHYLRINPFTGANIEDVAMGHEGFWHFYPALMVDRNKSVLLTFSRSGLTEYVGAYISGRKATDPLGLSSSLLLKTGEANYVKKFGGTRNRWGDYNGIGLDPVDSLSVWAFTEYAAFPANTWGTWVGKVKMGPLAGSDISLNRESVNFGSREVGNRSDTVSVVITNNGTDTLSISDIAFASGQHFKLVNTPSLPYKLGTFDSTSIRLFFAPQTAANLVDTIFLSSNDAVSAKTSIALSGKGFIITPIQKGVLYATTGTADGGRLLTVNSATAAVTPIGPSGYSQVTAVEVNPATKELVGIAPSAGGNLLLRINSLAGDAYPFANLPLDNPTGMAFKQDGTLYVGGLNGKIYTVNTTSGDTTLAASTGLILAGLAFNPITGVLWASVRPAVINKDRIYKIDLASGNPTLVGPTGLGGQTPDILFDNKGRLYGIIGIGANVNSLIKIDTSTGAGTIIGSMGTSSVQSIASSPDSVFTVVNQLVERTIPSAYFLYQNFPNPFNPSTQITYGLKERGQVSLKIFDVLGRELKEVVNSVQEAGWYFVRFDASDLASGVYYYRLKSGSFVESKKMLLVK